MANETTIPILPCGAIDELAEFYQNLGFERTYRQLRPNPYTVLRREDLCLHFFGIDGFDPEQSYGTCAVYVPDTGALYRSFAAGMRAAYGKILVSGIPRMTRPRKRKNTGELSGFTVIDPGGNWIRIFADPASTERESPASGESGSPGAQENSRLATVVENAVVLGESKGDHRQAARILDSTLVREEATAPVTDLVEALVYRAELAVRMDDGEKADALLARVRDTHLDEAIRLRLAETLDTARELEEGRREHEYRSDANGPVG